MLIDLIKELLESNRYNEFNYQIKNPSLNLHLDDRIEFKDTNNPYEKIAISKDKNKPYNTHLLLESMNQPFTINNNNRSIYYSIYDKPINRQSHTETIRTLSIKILSNTEYNIREIKIIKQRIIDEIKFIRSKGYPYTISDKTSNRDSNIIMNLEIGKLTPNNNDIIYDIGEISMIHYNGKSYLISLLLISLLDNQLLKILIK